ncbi:DUF4340 domain-containing protein [Coraliomargarita parva]|uniref:DUF4340 domain-containing protein n=1 Tax=Coraliomargarita parva TaxID=3014050 RepID=UPI0022B3F6E2|nr:DUF4340 domain-containing protein [Coraliomargarita parva]
MRFKFTIFLLALNLITFGLIYYLSHQSRQIDARMGGLSGQIGREIVDADRIELRGKELGNPRVLERDGANWTITQPLQWPANYFAINRILNQLQFIEEEASFSVEEIRNAGQSLGDYGLDNPALHLIIAEGEESIDLAIGTTTEIGNNVYLLGPKKENIFVVSRAIIDSLIIDLSDLRTRQIFSIPVFEVDALSLQMNASGASGNGELKVRLARTNNGWLFESPLTAEADPTLVTNTINQLTAAKVVRFPEGRDPVLQGLETPAMRVTLNGNKRRQTLLIGNLDPNATGEPSYFAKLEDNPTVFTVEAKAFDELREAQEALRERNFMNFDPDALNAINITESGREIRLQRLETGEDWQVIQSSEGGNIQPYRADPEVVDSLIDNLKNLRASSFIADAPAPADLARYGFNNPRRIVKLSLDNAPPITLQLSHPDDENELLYARNTQADFIYAVERRPTWRMLPLNALDYRSRTLETLPEAARIRNLKLERISDGEVLFDLQLPEGSIWGTLLAEQDEKEAEAIQTLLNAVRKMVVKAYLKENYADSYVLDPDTSLPWLYRLSAEIVLPGDGTDRIDTRTYVFTKRQSGTQQVCGSKQLDSIFQLPQPLIDALYVFIEDMPLPPEAKETDVPTPSVLEPVPEPAKADEIPAEAETKEAPEA